MAPFAETPIFSMFGDRSTEVFKEPDLLDGWWTSDYIFSLERRAIFSKKWICVTHQSRFTKPGDYVSLELAGFPILVILGKDHIVRAFHNVCRHRAYTITKKAAGSSLVLGCRYHGWSYDTKGNLVKAPHFDGIEGFDKSENGLFKIRTCTDRSGFVHINLDAGQLKHAPNCENIVNFAADHGIPASSKWLVGWEMNGGFNWKTMGASDRTGIGTLQAPGEQPSFMNLLLSMFRPSPMDVSKAQVVHIAPLTTIMVFPHSTIWAMLTVLPLSATQCNVHCNIYSSRENDTLPVADEEAIKIYFHSYIQALEERYNALKTGRPTEKPELLHTLKVHLKLERLEGREISPGRREDSRSESFCRAEKVCKDLDIMARAGKGRNLSKSTGTSGAVQSGLEW